LGVIAGLHVWKVYKPSFCRESKHDSSELRLARSLHSAVLSVQRNILLLVVWRHKEDVAPMLLRRLDSVPPFKYLGKSKAVPVYTMKPCEGLEVQLHLFLALALDGGEWSASRTDLPPSPLERSR